MEMQEVMVEAVLLSLQWPLGFVGFAFLGLAIGLGWIELSPELMRTAIGVHVATMVGIACVAGALLGARSWRSRRRTAARAR
jgi:hypothetical protein